MIEPSLTLPNAEWPYLQILMRLALSLALGLLIGLERERRGKEAGLRTFGFVCLLGAMGGSLGAAYSIVILLLVGVLAVLLNVQTLRANQGTELTTSAAMLVTCMAGILCGQGHTISPAAVIVISTALLAWKERLAGISMGLTESEVRSALMLAVLAIVIYPALPAGSVGPWKLIEPRAAWVAVILIAGIGFVNYALWKLYGAHGAEVAGFLGGLVNSNFTVVEMASRVRAGSRDYVDSAYRGILLATGAMVVRNAGLLLILAPLALAWSLWGFSLMLVAAALLVLWSYRARNRKLVEAAPEIKLDLPFSLPLALKYGLVFLLLHVLGGLTQKFFGTGGFYVVSVLGGLLSSASAVAAAATLAAQGSVSPGTAGSGAMLASFTSMVFSLSFVLRAGNAELTRRLVLAMVAMMALGALGLAMSDALQPLVARWMEMLEAAAPH